MGGYASLLKNFLLSQFLSLLLACMAVTSEALVERGFNAPTAQATLNYILLLMTFGTLAVRQRHRNPLPKNWKWYAVFALADVEANYLIVCAYRYTSITSVTLLDCATIPFVMLLSTAVLRTRYSARQGFGAFLCLAGLALLVLSDVTQFQRTNPSKSAAGGDAMVVAAALLYACSNVSEEFLIHQTSTVQVLGLLGLFGSMLNGIQMFCLEYSELLGLHWSWEILGFLLGFVLSLFTFYALVPSLLRNVGAAAFNLAMLTSDLWAAVARALWFGGFPSDSTALAFAGSLGLVTVGLVVFYLEHVKSASRDGKASRGEMDREDLDEAPHYVHLHEEPADYGGVGEDEENMGLHDRCNDTKRDQGVVSESFEQGPDS